MSHFYTRLSRSTNFFISLHKEPEDEQAQNSDKRKVFSDLRRAVDPADFRNIFTEAQEAEAKRDPVRLWAAFQDYANGIATVAGATIHKELWS